MLSYLGIFGTAADSTLTLMLPDFPECPPISEETQEACLAAGRKALNTALTKRLLNHQYIPVPASPHGPFPGVSAGRPLASSYFGDGRPAVGPFAIPHQPTGPDITYLTPSLSLTLRLQLYFLTERMAPVDPKAITKLTELVHGSAPIDFDEVTEMLVQEFGIHFGLYCANVPNNFGARQHPGLVPAGPRVPLAAEVAADPFRGARPMNVNVGHDPAKPRPFPELELTGGLRCPSFGFHIPVEALTKTTPILDPVGTEIYHWPMYLATQYYLDGRTCFAKWKEACEYHELTLDDELLTRTKMWVASVQRW